MIISETTDGQVAITAQGVTIMLNSSDAFELLCWLYDHRGTIRSANRQRIIDHIMLGNDADGEPLLEDCPYCRGAHLAGTIEQCPLHPNNAPIGDVVAAYRAMEGALQLLTVTMINLRTELLVALHEK